MRFNNFIIECLGYTFNDFKKFDLDKLDELETKYNDLLEDIRVCFE